jgi:hypothetical protein
MILRIIADTKSDLAQERRSLSAESGNWPLRGQGMPFSLRAPAPIGLNASPVSFLPLQGSFDVTADRSSSLQTSRIGPIPTRGFF